MYYISISMYIILYILFPPFCNAHINIQEQIFIYPIWNQVSHETWPMGGGGSGSVHTQLRSGAWAVRTWPRTSAADDPSVSKSVFTITEKAPTRAFPWLNAPKSIFTFKALWRNPRYVDVTTSRSLLRDCENRLWNRWIVCSTSPGVPSPLFGS